MYGLINANGAIVLRRIRGKGIQLSARPASCWSARECWTIRNKLKADKRPSSEIKRECVCVLNGIFVTADPSNASDRPGSGSARSGQSTLPFCRWLHGGAEISRLPSRISVSLVDRVGRFVRDQCNWSAAAMTKRWMFHEIWTPSKLSLRRTRTVINIDNELARSAKTGNAAFW